MRSDWVDGFRLDRGFQVFQSAYPEAKAAFDYRALRLQPLVAGALVRTGSKWISMVDPLRHPSYTFSTLLNSIGNLGDRFRLARLQWQVARTPVESYLAAGQDKSTHELLSKDFGFSDDFVQRFMKPWLSGIFLESELTTSAKFFCFVFKMLSSGKVMYPSLGIQVIPDQLAAQLPKQSIRLNCPIRAVEKREGRLDGGTVPTKNRDVATVLAVAMPQAKSILANSHVSSSVLHGNISESSDVDRGCVGTTCIYFVANRPPIAEPILMLNGEGDGPVNHVFVVSNASREIAPNRKALISVSLVGDTLYDSGSVRCQLQGWFGTQAAEWSELAVYRIPQALPRQPPGFTRDEPIRELQNIILCGDYCGSASLDGALRSGRMAGEVVARRRSSM